MSTTRRRGLMGLGSACGTALMLAAGMMPALARPTQEEVGPTERPALPGLDPEPPKPVPPNAGEEGTYMIHEDSVPQEQGAVLVQKGEDGLYVKLGDCENVVVTPRDDLPKREDPRWSTKYSGATQLYGTDYSADYRERQRKALLRQEIAVHNAQVELKRQQRKNRITPNKLQRLEARKKPW